VCDEATAFLEFLPFNRQSVSQSVIQSVNRCTNFMLYGMNI